MSACVRVSLCECISVRPPSPTTSSWECKAATATATATATAGRQLLSKRRRRRTCHARALVGCRHSWSALQAANSDNGTQSCRSTPRAAVAFAVAVRRRRRPMAMGQKCKEKQQKIDVKNAKMQNVPLLWIPLKRTLNDESVCKILRERASEKEIFSSTQRDLSCSSFPPTPEFPTSLRAGMELLKLMMFKTDFLSNGKCDDRVPPINLSQLPEFLLCKCTPTPFP